MEVGHAETHAAQKQSHQLSCLLLLGNSQPSLKPITVNNFLLVEDTSFDAVREVYLLRQHHRISPSWKHFNVSFSVLDLCVKFMRARESFRDFTKV